MNNKLITYFLVGQITLNAVTLYLAVVYAFLGELKPITIILFPVNMYLMIKYNTVFHYLIEKYLGKW